MELILMDGWILSFFRDKKSEKNVTAILTSLLCASRERGMCSPKKSIGQNPLLVHVEVSL
jgi:hypothetical protein